MVGRAYNTRANPASIIMETAPQHAAHGTPSRKIGTRTTQPWLLVAALSLLYHAAPTTSAFLSPSTLTSSSTSSASLVNPNGRYRHYSPTSRIIHPGEEDTAMAATATTVQPLTECCALFNSAAFASSSLDIAAGVFNTNNIKIAFSVATFFPQLPWLLLILLPNANVTKKLVGGYGEQYLSFSAALDTLAFGRASGISYHRTHSKLRHPYIIIVRRDSYHLLPRAFLHCTSIRCSARWYCPHGRIFQCIRPKW